ncbi:hypothetical protein [Bradyrhizobium sp. LB11.1]|uniref:hypothetical protein n=1 Tax=Bradyrhizobium sp. LB11.1 TaxID=3156326 RepID=UPI00339ADEB0
MAKITKQQTTQIERIRAVHPGYAALLEKNAQLYARHEEVIAEIKPLAEESRRSQVSWVAQSPKPKPKPVVRHSGAVELLGNLLPEQTTEELDPPPPRPAWPGEHILRALGEESEAITEAIKLLAPEIIRAKREYSRKVAEQRGPEYRAIVSTLVDSAKSLADAVLAHHEFIDQQRRDSVSWAHFRPVNLNAFGDLNDDGSPLRRLILDAIEQAHVDASKAPDWRMTDLLRLQNGG